MPTGPRENLVNYGSSRAQPSHAGTEVSRGTTNNEASPRSEARLGRSARACRRGRRDGAHAPGVASYSVTFSDARVVARSERVRIERERARLLGANPVAKIAVATTSNGVALAAYVVGGDVGVTRIRPADGVRPIRMTQAIQRLRRRRRRRRRSRFPERTSAGAARHRRARRRRARRDVRRGQHTRVDIIALDGGSIAIAGLTRLEMPHASLAVCPAAYPLLAVSTRDSVEVLDLRLEGGATTRCDASLSPRCVTSAATTARLKAAQPAAADAGSSLAHDTPFVGRVRRPDVRVASASVIGGGGSRRPAVTSRRGRGRGRGRRPRVNVYVARETVRKTTGPETGPRFPTRINESRCRSGLAAS